MKPKIYIAGPMRGYPDFNRAAFNAAAERLAAKGWQPVNPVDVERIYPCMDDSGKEDGAALGRLMAVEREIARMCDAVYLLNGWERSDGATLELGAVVGTFGRTIHLESNGTPEAVR